MELILQKKQLFITYIYKLHEIDFKYYQKRIKKP